MPDISNITLPDGNTYNLIDATVPHTSETAASGGTALSLVTTGEKYIWNSSYGKVTQTHTTANSAYRLLLSGTSDDTTYTGGVLKRNKLTYNPSTYELKVENSDSSYRYTIVDGTNIKLIYDNTSAPQSSETDITSYSIYMYNNGVQKVKIDGLNGTLVTGSLNATTLNSGVGNTIAVANGDRIIVSDSSDSDNVRKTTIIFDGSTTNQCLTPKGTWQTFGTSNLAIGTTSTTASAGNHTHGSITNAGAITGTTALASGDGIIFADSSDSSKLKRSSITFDGSTSTKCLTQAGTWASFTNNAGTVTGSGTANYLAKWSSGSGLTNGALYSYVTSGFTAARCTVVAGGYQQIGKVVHVDIHIKFTAATSATQVILGVFPEEAVANVSLVGTVDGSYQDTIYGFRINARNLYANGSRSSGGQWHIFGSYIAK